MDTIVKSAFSCFLAFPLLILQGAASDAGPPARGRICIAPVNERMRSGDPTDPRGSRPRRDLNFSVQVDGGARVHVPESEALAVRNLDLSKTHVVRIFDGSKVIESFRFKFKSKGARVLCLSYGPWYETWDLSPPGRGLWCKCR